MENLPLVSVIIPCRNEAKFIANCLESILKQSYPKDKMEILVIDGMSGDKTREIIEKLKAKNEKLKIKVLDNPKKFTPFALNIGIKNSKGEIIIRLDAHATYIKDYILKCIKYLKEYNADNVGGVWKIMPRETTLINKSICLASSSVFGAGNAYYRMGYSKGLKWVDTVFGGCYRREVFDKIGLFNENLKRSQDMEFNLRLKKAGGKILLVPDIIAYYYPKSNFKEFFVHNFKDGIWAIYPLKFVKIPLCLRHYIPFIFILSLLGTGLLGIFFPIFFWLFLFIFGSYFLVANYFSVKISTKEKDIRFLFLMPVAFACRHIGYGLGSIWGLIKIFFK